MLEDMDLQERQVFLQESHIQQQEAELQSMVDQNKQDLALAAEFSQQAKVFVEGDESELAQAELCAELATLTKRKRYSIGDIRKQRETVQWEKKKLKGMISPTE